MNSNALRWLRRGVLTPRGADGPRNRGRCKGSGSGLCWLLDGLRSGMYLREAFDVDHTKRSSADGWACCVCVICYIIQLRTARMGHGSCRILSPGLVVLVAFAANRSWRIWSFVLHKALQIPANLTSPRVRQQQVILRNSETAAVHGFHWLFSHTRAGEDLRRWLSLEGYWFC